MPRLRRDPALKKLTEEIDLSLTAREPSYHALLCERIGRGSIAPTQADILLEPTTGYLLGLCEVDRRRTSREDGPSCSSSAADAARRRRSSVGFEAEASSPLKEKGVATKGRITGAAEADRRKERRQHLEGESTGEAIKRSPEHDQAVTFGPFLSDRTAFGEAERCPASAASDKRGDERGRSQTGETNGEESGCGLSLERVEQTKEELRKRYKDNEVVVQEREAVSSGDARGGTKTVNDLIKEVSQAGTFAKAVSSFQNEKDNREAQPERAIQEPDAYAKELGETKQREAAALSELDRAISRAEAAAPERDGEVKSYQELEETLQRQRLRFDETLSLRQEKNDMAVEELQNTEEDWQGRLEHAKGCAQAEIDQVGEEAREELLAKAKRKSAPFADELRETKLREAAALHELKVANERAASMASHMVVIAANAKNLEVIARQRRIESLARERSTFQKMFLQREEHVRVMEDLKNKYEQHAALATEGGHVVASLWKKLGETEEALYGAERLCQKRRDFLEKYREKMQTTIEGKCKEHRTEQNLLEDRLREANEVCDAKLERAMVHVQEASAARVELSTRLSAAQVQLSELQSLHDERLRSMEESHAKQLSSLKAELEKKNATLITREQESREQLDDFKKQKAELADVINAKCDEHNAERQILEKKLMDVAVECDMKLDRAMQDVRKESAARAKLSTSLSAAQERLSGLKIMHEEEVRSLKVDHTKELSSLRQELEKATTELSDVASSSADAQAEQSRLRTQCEQLQRANSELQVKLDATATLAQSNAQSLQKKVVLANDELNGLKDQLEKARLSHQEEIKHLHTHFKDELRNKLSEQRTVIEQDANQSKRQMEAQNTSLTKENKSLQLRIKEAEKAVAAAKADHEVELKKLCEEVEHQSHCAAYDSCSDKKHRQVAGSPSLCAMEESCRVTQDRSEVGDNVYLSMPTCSSADNLVSSDDNAPSDDVNSSDAKSSSDVITNDDTDQNNDTRSARNNDAASETDNTKGLSEYELARLRRIERNNSRLAALGLLDAREALRSPVTSITKRKRRRSVEGERQQPLRHQPQRAAKLAQLTNTGRQQLLERGRAGATMDHVDDGGDATAAAEVDGDVSSISSPSASWSSSSSSSIPSSSRFPPLLPESIITDTAEHIIGDTENEPDGAVVETEKDNMSGNGKDPSTSVKRKAPASLLFKKKKKKLSGRSARVKMKSNFLTNESSRGVSSQQQNSLGSSKRSRNMTHLNLGENSKKSMHRVLHQDPAFTGEYLRALFPDTEPEEAMPIDIRDKNYVWSSGIVVAVNTVASTVTVLPDGHGADYTETLDWPNLRLARFRTYSKSA